MSNTFNNYKLIYIFSIDDIAHRGLLKVGEATFTTNENPINIKPNSEILNNAARKRIDSYTKTAGVKYNLLYTESAVCTIEYKDGTKMISCFRDKDVHNIYKSSGVKVVWPDGVSSAEWFQIDLPTAIKGIYAVKNGCDTLDFDCAWTEIYNTEFDKINLDIVKLNQLKSSIISLSEDAAETVELETTLLPSRKHDVEHNDAKERIVRLEKVIPYMLTCREEIDTIIGMKKVKLEILGVLKDAETDATIADFEKETLQSDALATLEECDDNIAIRNDRLNLLLDLISLGLPSSVSGEYTNKIATNRESQCGFNFNIKRTLTNNKIIQIGATLSLMINIISIICLFATENLLIAIPWFLFGVLFFVFISIDAIKHIDAWVFNKKQNVDNIAPLDTK
jgi:hypothetical protein